MTGSAGKTTTKEAVAQVLSAKFRVLKSQGNLNNGFGLPLQLLRLEPEHEVAVIEMGMNHAGEIAALAQIAEPDWAVVSNVAPVHLEHFADGIEGIARAKYELVEALPPDGIAVLNCDDERVASFGDGMGERAVFYGTGECARRARGADCGDWRGGRGVHRDCGRGARERAAAAAGPAQCAQCAGGDCGGAAERHVAGGVCGGARRDCAQATSAARVIEWRGATLINDSYNSNPRALDAMVDALLAMPVGERQAHRGCGRDAGAGAGERGAAPRVRARMAERGVDFVLGVRGHGRGAGGWRGGCRCRRLLFVATPEEAAAWLKANLCEGDAVLLKASRGVRLERALLTLSPPISDKLRLREKLVRSRDQVLGQALQRRGGGAEGFERREGVRDQVSGFAAGLFDPEDGRPCGFDARGILAGGLAEFLGGLRDVEDVVDDLEGQPGLLAKGAEACDRLRACTDGSERHTGRRRRCWW